MTWFCCTLTTHVLTFGVIPALSWCSRAHSLSFSWSLPLKFLYGFEAKGIWVSRAQACPSSRTPAVSYSGFSVPPSPAAARASGKSQRPAAAPPASTAGSVSLGRGDVGLARVTAIQRRYSVPAGPALDVDKDRRHLGPPLTHGAQCATRSHPLPC